MFDADLPTPDKQLHRVELSAADQCHISQHLLKSTMVDLKEEGNKLFKEGDFLHAAAAYTKAIKQDPKNSVLYRWALVMLLLMLLKLRAQWWADSRAGTACDVFCMYLGNNEQHHGTDSNSTKVMVGHALAAIALRRCCALIRLPRRWQMQRNASSSAQIGIKPGCARAWCWRAKASCTRHVSLLPCQPQHRCNALLSAGCCHSATSATSAADYAATCIICC